MSQFNSMIQSMHWGVKLVLCVLFAIFIILIMGAICRDEKRVDEQVVIMNNHQLDSVFVARLESTSDSVKMLNQELIDLQNKVALLLDELNKLKTAQQISRVINPTQPILKSSSE